MLKEIAPRRNTGIYLSGHLIAVSDALFPLLGFGERLFPALEDVFIKQPDKSGQAMPTVTELKKIVYRLIQSWGFIFNLLLLRNGLTGIQLYQPKIL